MRFALVLAAWAAVLAAPTFSQTDEPVPATENKVDAPPLAGANSFTQAQAVARLEDNGFTAVSNLRMDQNSIWRGQAKKNGKPVNVALDFQGNIVISD